MDDTNIGVEAIAVRGGKAKSKCPYEFLSVMGQKYL